MGDSEPGIGSAPAPGTRVGAYVIDAFLGSGGVATVYRAHDAANQPVALKILHPSRVVDEDKKRFSREYRALARMDHPNVVRVLEAGVDDGYPWLAMEFVDGEDLDGVIARWESVGGQSRFPLVERIFRDLCAALQYVHERGLVHRDLKPSNVLIRKDGVAKITDFGVVKDAHAATTNLTVAGRLVGTVAFMAPEQITGDKVDARCDLYALGAVLYNMLTYHRPIEASSVAGYLARHLTEVPRPPSELDPNVPAPLERVCQRLLAKDPNQRYATAQAVIEALDRAESGDGRPIRGRETEIADWQKRISALQNGAGGALALVGESGSGRTHLVRHLIEAARQAGVHALAFDGGAGSVVDLISDSLAIPAAVDPADRLASGLRGRPVVIAIDDLGKLGPLEVNSLAKAFRTAVANEGEPAMLLVTSSPRDPRLAELGNALGIPLDRAELGPIDRRALLAILRDRGVQGALLPLLSRRLHDDHEGRVGSMIEQIDALIAAGWLAVTGDIVNPTRPLESYRRGPLPVPPAVKVSVSRRVAELEDEARDLVDALAIVDRPASAVLLAACLPDQSLGDMDAARELERLVRDGLLSRRAEEESDVVYGFSHPSAAQVVRERLPIDAARRWHKAVAAALAKRRRREASFEVATHLLAAGELLAAYPALVQAARAAARGGRTAEVFDIVLRARQIEPDVLPSLDAREAAKQRRWLLLLEGEARLARGEWADAIGPLQAAVEAAKIEGDPASLARCMGSLGRAFYRMGRFDQARPVIEAALRDLDPGAPERAAATRALADILLRAGDVAAAEKMWDESLQIAKAVQSKDGEARARRGLANVRVLQGRYDEAKQLLDAAEDILQGAGGDGRVLAAVLARNTELDLLAGRFGAALRRCETLHELAAEKELADRLPEAWALLADAHSGLGRVEQTADAARHVLTWVKASPDPAARIRAARALAMVGKGKDALALLPAPEELPTSKSSIALDDPPAQVAAIRARAMAREAPDQARDMATWAAGRPPAQVGFRNARTWVDAALALAALGEVELARGTAKRALKALQTTSVSQTGLQGPTDAYVLDALVALWAAQPDDRVAQAAMQVAERVAATLPPALGNEFRRRADLQALKGG